MISIYVLKHPNTSAVFYVGITSQANTKVRLNQHCNHALRGYGNNNKKTAYIRNLLNQNLRPVLKVVQTCENNRNIYSNLERYWINCFRKLQFKLLNLTDGGEFIDPKFSRLGGYNARGIKPTTKKFSSSYVGVRWHKLRKKWQAYLNLGKTQINLGLYNEEEKAAQAYDKATLLLVKTGVIRLNFSEEDYAGINLEEWYESTKKIYSSKHKYIHFCNTHERWLVSIPKHKVKRFKLEKEAVKYLTTLS